MQNVQELQEKIFFEVQSILESLSKISSKEELLTKQDLFSEVTDRIAFLRILEKNKDSFVSEETMQSFDNQEINNNFDLNESDDEYDNQHEDILEEEVRFTNELNDIQDDEISPEPEIKEPEVEEVFFNTSNTEYDENGGKILEIEKEQEVTDVVHEPFAETKVEPVSGDKKFKLAHIKGLKAVEKIIADVPLDDPENEIQIEKGSLLKANVSTDYMEAEKPKPEFRLDLNDKVAFTKLLFNGDEADLKSTVEKLNSFADLEDAKRYLSDIYYEKDWKKVDEYAQRLWMLVENKFQ